MATNKIELRSVEEFMAGYTPVYQPIYPLFLTRSQSYSEETGKIDFRRVNTIGDIRASRITPKSTEISQINVSEAKKTFKKYFLANQFQISQMQDQQGVEDVVAQVLDEHQTQMDELMLLGEGKDVGSVVNNSLFWSNDSNYNLQNSVTIQNTTSYLPDLHSKVLQNTYLADRLSGSKLLIFYGSNILPVVDSLYATAAKPFRVALQEVLGANYSISKLPPQITPAGANGWLVASLDHIKTHYTSLPQLSSQGANDEKLYYFFNFILGSCMTECLAQNAIIRQPATLA